MCSLNKADYKCVVQIFSMFTCSFSLFGLQIIKRYIENAHSFWMATIRKAQKTTGGEKMQRNWKSYALLLGM